MLRLGVIESLRAISRHVAESSFTHQLRNKTWTSNVMDATRSRRIREHQAYHKAMKQWRLEVHGRIEAWRSEIRGKNQIEIDAKMLLRAGGRVTNEASSHEAQSSRPEMTPEQKRQHELREELKKAQLDYDLANMKLIRAQRQKQLMEGKAVAEELKRRLLLQSSRKWIDSSQELKERINATLDNPQPFGFITELQKSPRI